MILAGLVVVFAAAWIALAPGFGLAALAIVAALLATMLCSGSAGQAARIHRVSSGLHQAM